MLMAGSRPGRPRLQGAGEYVVKGGGGINRAGRLTALLGRPCRAICPLVAGVGGSGGDRYVIGSATERAGPGLG